MSWVKVLTKEKATDNVAPSKKQRHRKVVDAPDISHIPTPDDAFDHKYNYPIILIEEKLQEHLAHNGYDAHLLANLRAGDLQKFAKYSSSEFDQLSYHYRRQVRGIYRKTKAT